MNLNKKDMILLFVPITIYYLPLIILTYKGPKEYITDYFRNNIKKLNETYLSLKKM